MKRRAWIMVCVLGVVCAAGQAEARWWERKTDRQIDRRVDRKMDRNVERRDERIDPERPAVERMSDRRINRRAERQGERKKARRDDRRGAERHSEPRGNMRSSESAITKTGDGSYTVEGTRTGPAGHTTTVDRTVAKQADGSYDIHSTYTGEGGNTLTTDKSVQRTQDGRTVTGTYETSTGKEGAFAGSVTHEDGTITKTKAIVTSDGKTLERSRTLTLDGSGHPESQSSGVSESSSAPTP